MEEEIYDKFEKNEYIYKIIYLIRTNLPSNEFLYIIMFFLKYLGLILFSISLNEEKNMQNNKHDDFIPLERNSTNPPIFPDNNIGSQNSRRDIFSIFNFLSKLLINGNSLKILINHYQELCLFGFFLLIIYVGFVIFGFIYMKKKYYEKTPVSTIDKKIKKINSSNFEKKLFKILTYIFFIIVFFHQYIIEYYLFGFLGYICNFFGIFNESTIENNNIKYTSYILEHLSKLSFQPIIIIIFNLITIILVLSFFILFMSIISTKSLFLNKGIPFYGNKKYLLIKIIIFNYNPLYGILNAFDGKVKNYITIIIIIIICIINFVNIILSFYNFSFYPRRLNHICLFIEFFSFYAIIIELIIYLTNSKIDSLKFDFIKLIIQLSNSLIFCIFYIYKKEEFKLKLFTSNLFNKTFKTLNPDDIYYYIEIYLKYEKDKINNYLIIFRIIKNHILSCNKRDCPDKILIPKNMSYSLFTNFSELKNDDFQNKKIQNNYIKKNEEKIYNINNNLSNENAFQTNDKNILESVSDDKTYTTSKASKGKHRSSKILKIIEDPNLKKKKTDLMEKSINEKENDINITSKSNNKNNSIINYNNIEIESNIKINNNPEVISEKELNINAGKKRLKDDQFIMIGEQEIINRINFLYKHKKYDILEMYIFIHLQYLIKIKLNYRLALYFVYKYSQSEIKLSFLSKYFLYEIKKFICKSIIKTSNVKIVKDPYIIKYKEENILMKRIINYILFLNMIKKLLKISCEKIIYFYTFRTELHSPLSLQKYTHTKIYPIIKSAEMTESCIFKLKFLIEKYYKDENHPIESIELCYLISNFFNLIEGKLSEMILKCISPILYFKEFHYEKLENEFHVFNMSNPLIISLTKKDSFEINYFTNKILEKLNYSFLDLKNKDFHEKLFPGGQKLIKEHTYILKQFLFFYNNIYTKDKTFLKSKEGYLIPINLICRTFPNFSDNFFLISNIIFEDEQLSDIYLNTIKNYKNSNNINDNKDKIVKIYSFLLNCEFDFFGTTKNFYEEYELNRKMFSELKINFCQFFCVDENKLLEQIKKEKKKLFKKYPNFYNKISLNESNKAYTIFQNIEIKNAFKIRQEKFLENYFYPPLFIYDKIDKKKLIQKIPEIISIIDEIGLDYEWNIKLQNFKDRLISNCHFRNIKESIISSLDHEKFLKNLLENKHSTITDQNAIKQSYVNNPEQYFEIVYSVKKLGHLLYYIVNLHENINNNFEETQITNESENIISSKNSMNLINNNKILKKISPKKTINIKNKEREMKEIILKPTISKTSSKIKVSFSDSFKSNIKTKNTLSNYKQAFDNLQINDNIVEKGSKKNVEINFDINKENDKNNKIINNKKNSKFFSNKEYLKKIKRNEFDEEENTPLITKDRFKEILFKNNKRNKILVILIYILIIISILLIIIKFGYCFKGFEETKNVLLATIYLEMLKVDIYSEAILSFLYCIYENNNLIELSSIHMEAKESLKNTLNHLKELQNHINIILKNKNSVRIFKIIEERFLINILTNDWDCTNKKVDILEEMRRLSYVVYSLTSSNETCNISLFYELSEKGNNLFRQTYKENANEIQKIAFYFFSNILTNYRDTFDRLSNECAISLENMWKYYQNILFYLLISINIILLFFIISYIIKVCFDFSFYQLLFFYYYNNENEYFIFKNKVYYLYNNINDFNIDNISYFEYSKSNIYLLEYNEINDKTSFNYIKNNNKNNIEKNNRKRNSQLFKQKEGNNKYNNNFLYKNTSNGSFLNGSINGSSIQILNKSNNSKVPLNNNFENNSSFSSDINEKDQKNISQEDSIDTLLKFSNKLLPNSIIISLILITICVIIFSLLSYLNISELDNENKMWKNSIYLSMNILERVPRLMGIVIYACITLISNNPNIIEGSPMNNNQIKYISYFKANSLYYSEDVMNKYFKTNFFGELLRDNLKINYNFNNYLFQKEHNIFTKTQEMETNLNKGGYFCIYSGIGEILELYEELTNYEFIEKLNNKVLNCQKQNKGINESGAQLEITYILQEITNKYIEFITYNSTNISLNTARENFFYSSSIKRIFEDIQYPLLMYYNSIIYSVKSDLNNQNSSIANKQILYSCLLFWANFILILCLLFSITKDEKNKKSFSYFSEIPKINK